MNRYITIFILLAIFGFASNQNRNKSPFLKFDAYFKESEIVNKIFLQPPSENGIPLDTLMRLGGKLMKHEDLDFLKTENIISFEEDSVLAVAKVRLFNGYSGYLVHKTGALYPEPYSLNLIIFDKTHVEHSNVLLLYQIQGDGGYGFDDTWIVDWNKDDKPDILKREAGHTWYWEDEDVVNSKSEQFKIYLWRDSLFVEETIIDTTGLKRKYGIPDFEYY